MSTIEKLNEQIAEKKMKEEYQKAVKTFHGNKCTMCGNDQLPVEQLKVCRLNKEKANKYNSTYAILLCPSCKSLKKINPIKFYFDFMKQSPEKVKKMINRS